MTARKLTLEERAAIEGAALMTDEDINLGDPDAPEVTNWADARRGALFRAIKQPVTMRVDADVLTWFKRKFPKGYQTRMNEALREYVEHHEGESA